MNRMTCLVLLGLISATPTLYADTAVPPVPPRMEASLKMDAALAAAKHLANGGVTLAVSAADVSLPTGAIVPGDPLTGQQVGALYQQATQPFGSILAIAPPTITVVYAPPETPNPYDGMPPGQVMKLLAATFTPVQWKAFMSPTGVAYADMTGDTQPPLFRALFPDGHLKLIQDNPTGPNDPKTQQDLSGDSLAAAHLRLGSITSLALQISDNPSSHVFAMGLRPANAPPRYFMTNSQGREIDREYGAQVRETVPNAPKSSQLAFDDPALKIAVSLANIKTVDDLVTRIGLTTRREIYADPRYGSRLVTFAPSSAPPSAPAADLLKALAFCVGGAYRQVGPAYVLTDDVVGLGTKHVLWKEFEDKAAKMQPGGGEFYSNRTATPDIPYTVQDIPDSGDPLAMSAKQKEQYWNKWALNPSQSSRTMTDITVPFNQLTPAQQEAAQMSPEASENSHTKTTLGGTVMVQTEPVVEILLPSVGGPVMIFESYDSLLPYPALTPTQEKTNRKRMEADFPDLASPDAPAPDFAQTLRGFARRAARIDLPDTSKAAADTFAALHALGFTEAWIPVQPGPVSGDDALRAQMTQAAAEGRKHGIVVLPDLSLLHWTKDVSPELLDHDIQGRTTFPRYNALSPLTVSPFVPAAGTRLTALVHSLGSVPGVGGMVWDDILASGYEKDVPGENIGGDPFDAPLGYADAGRLAFLRVDHADPVDVQDNSYSDERAKVHVPDFDGDGSRERRLYTDWRRLRADTAQALLWHLAAALPSSFSRPKTRLPLLLPPSNISFTNSYGSWDNFHRPAPTVRFIAQTGPDGQPVPGAASTERMTSAVAYAKLSVYSSPKTSDAEWKTEAARSLTQAAKHGSTNVVLDLTGQPGLLRGK